VGARRPVFGEQVSGEHRRDLLLAIERHVHRKVDPDHPRDRAHVIVDRVAFRDAPGGARVADAGGIVQRHHRLESRQPWRHHLRAAAEAGKEMRLHKARRDPDVRVQELAIQVNGDAR
jgi:hypothetical protein